MRNNKPYNGQTNNCSDNAKIGVEATGTKVDAQELIATGQSANTPNSLFKATGKLPNATVLKDPGKAVNNGFIEGAKGGVIGKAAQSYEGGQASPPRESTKKK